MRGVTHTGVMVKKDKTREDHPSLENAGLSEAGETLQSERLHQTLSVPTPQD